MQEVMEMDTEEEGGNVSESVEGVEGSPGALGALYFLTQDAEPSVTTLVDDCNGFNKLSRLAMLWNVRHRWPARARFAFNFYRHWAKLLLRHLGETPVTILSR